MAGDEKRRARGGHSVAQLYGKAVACPVCARDGGFYNCSLAGRLIAWTPLL